MWRGREVSVERERGECGEREVSVWRRREVSVVIER